jgi:hypothetical protein
MVEDFMKKNVLMCLLLALSLLSFVACSEKQETRKDLHDEDAFVQEKQVHVPIRVEVANEILSAWRAVRVEVIDLVTAKPITYTINIGSDLVIADTGLTVKALNFLPAFQMNVPIITSRSNKLENPAAQIEVYEAGKQIFKGWLFTLYPTTHAFTHPKYSITLLEGIAVD